MADDYSSKGSGDTFSQHPTGLSVPPNAGKESEDVKKWLGILARTESWRNTTLEKMGGPRFVKEFEGDWDLLQQNVDIPLIPINMVFAYVKTEVARLYFRDPWISVQPKRVEDLGAARIAEQLVNYLWGEINLKQEVKLALTDALLMGHGWIKLGYTAEFGEKSTVVESKPKEKRGPGRPRKDDPNVDTNEYVKSENVFAYHLRTDDVVFDPSATWPPTHNARWMAFKTIKPLSVVQDSGLYKESVVRELKPTELAPSDRNVYGQEGKWVTVWEIWDKEHKQVKTLAQGSDKYLKEPMNWPYPFDGYPAVMFSFNPIPNKPYPLSDIAPWEGQVIEMMKMHSIMINHLKRWNRQVFLKAGLLTEEEKVKFKNAIDGGIIEYQGNKDDLFIPPYAPVQQDIYGVWGLTMDVFRNVSGQTETDRGGNAVARTRTLGELNMALHGSRTRADERVDMLESQISELARKILTIMQDKFDIPKIIRTVGQRAIQKAIVESRPSAQGAAQPTSYTGANDQGGIDAFSITKDDIHGEMDVDCLAGSTIPLNKDNQLEVMEKLTPSLELVGIRPGSRAAREYGREYLRLINLMSLDRIMDIAEEEAQSGQVQNPQMMKAQADMQKTQMKGQIDMQKAKMDMAGKQQDLSNDKQRQQMEMQALAAKTQAEIIKAKTHMQKSQMDLQQHLLKSLLGPPSSGNGGGRGSGGGQGGSDGRS